MSRRAVVALVALLGAACAGDAEPARDDLRPSVTADCPRLPDGLAADGFALWPDEDARGLVPELESWCATPTSPHLFGMLNEQAGWSSGDLDAAALGVLHRSNHELATFTVVDVAPETPGFEGAREALAAAGETTQAGDVTVAWARSGEHVAAYWIDGGRVVSLAAEDADAALEAATAWREAQGEAAPEPPEAIPEAMPMPAALEAGPPLAGLPSGYRTVELDPIAVMQSDFADTVTIFDDTSVRALGAAVVLDEDGVLGTMVAGTGDPEIGSWPGQLPRGEAPSAAFSAGDTSVYVAGYDRDEVERFVAEWRKSLKS